MIQPRIPIIIGLQFGDEGKGTSVDFFCSQSPIDWVVRFSGGPQTAHNVVTSDGKEHTFAQFGSGTFQGAGTILSKHMLVNPFNLAMEADRLWDLTDHDPLNRTFISENALLITPLHVAANRQREINRGGDAHGSCGEGIGETRSYAIYETPNNPMVMGDLLQDRAILQAKMQAYKDYLVSNLENFTNEFNIEETLDSYELLLSDRPVNIISDDRLHQILTDAEGRLIFEGSQGILLDEAFGFHPHTTWSDITAQNAISLLEAAGYTDENYEIFGIMRTYMTRHGYGPFPSEFLSDRSEDYPEKHNTWGRFQGSWRIGMLDLPLLSYAVQIQPVDKLILTHCDIQPDNGFSVVLGGKWESVTPLAKRDRVAQEVITDELKSCNLDDAVVGLEVHMDDLLRIIPAYAQAPVSVLSYGPLAGDKHVIG